jgi:hypothetical protein
MKRIVTAVNSPIHIQRLVFLLSLILFLLSITSSFAQSNADLSADLAKKVPETQNTKVIWKKTGYGSMGFYTIENRHRMSLYNTSGEYIESFLKEAWDDRVSPTVKMEFDNSPYNACNVVGFWESTVANNKMYYLELIDRQDGTSKEAWFDEDGKFSKNPF